jgi:HAD superfamily hydrolase (TIGR01549 family)
MSRATTFDLFGTLLDVAENEAPADAIATELSARGVSVPDDWQAAYRTPQIETEPGAECPLPEHVHAILDDGSPPDRELIREAVLAAFDQPVETRPDAGETIGRMAERGPVGLLSNCSVPGLVDRTLRRSERDSDRFDAIVTSVGCGWRKPDWRAFEAVATRLHIPVEKITHVGDNPVTDGGAVDAGADCLLLDDVSLAEIPVRTHGGR